MYIHDFEDWNWLLVGSQGAVSEDSNKNRLVRICKVGDLLQQSFSPFSPLGATIKLVCP